MNREVAERLMEELQALSNGINEVACLVEDIGNLEEKKLLRSLVSTLMSGSYDLMMPIIRQHPDLDPDKND